MSGRPLQRFGWPVLLGVAIVSGALAVTARILVFERAPPREVATEHYHCPMHPSIVQEGPGTCPICGMQLVSAGGERSAAPRKVAFYRSPMDPRQTSQTPRKDEMGMDYIPVYDEADGSGESTVPGLASVHIDPARQQLIGLATAEVVRGTFGGQLRSVGRVAFDETRIRNVNVKTAGFVEEIFVNFIGQSVRAGEPLFRLFSPELYAAQSDYLLALKTTASLDGGAMRTGAELIGAARRRLELKDVASSEIDRLAQTGTARKDLLFFSPATGVVTKKNIVKGMALPAGSMPYEIVDLRVVWLLVDVYESELRFVTVGTSVVASFEALPGELIQGKVAFVDPVLDPTTRTVKVRVALPNPHMLLKPGMFGTATLQTNVAPAIIAPRSAIIDSGNRQVAFVALGDGKFEPRRVRVGRSADTGVEILDGLKPGERVVTRANFLIDSESNLRASLEALLPSSEARAPSDAQRGDAAQEHRH